MNESNFCKIKLLLFWGICLFLFPFCVSNADNVMVVSTSYGNAFMDGSRYIGAYCSGNLKYFDIQKNSMGDYFAKLKDSTWNVVDEHVSESMTCTFLKDVNRNIFNGEVTYVFNYSRSSESNTVIMDKNIVVHMYQGRLNNSYDIIGGTSLSGVKEIFNVKISSGSDYINLNCPNGSKTCVATLKDNLEFSSSVKEAVVNLDYKDSINREGHAKLTIKIHSEKTIYANKGSMGVCQSFGKGWEFLSGDTYYYNYNGLPVKFPSCDASKSANPLYKFIGWSNSDDLTNVTNQCNEKDVIAAGSDFKPDLSASPFYSTCYVSSNGIGLVVGSKGNLTSVDVKNWSKKNDIYYKLSDEGIALPTPAPIKGYTFQGWMESNDSDLINGGTVVDPDGAIYYAYFEKEGTSYEADNVIKTLYAGSVTVYKLPGVTFVSGSCSSNDSSKVAVASTSSGACYLIAKAPTAVSEYVTITAKDASDNTYQIKAQVVSTTGASELELGESVFTVKLPSFQDMIGVNGTNNSNNTNTVSSTMANGLTCRKYFVTRNGISDDFTNTISGTGESNSINFRAKSECDQNVVYSALCLDPGRLGPDKDGSGGKYYYVSRELHPSNDNNNQAKFDKGIASILSYLTTNGQTNAKLSDKNNEYRIAANLAARIMAIYYGESAENDNTTFPGSYSAHVKLTNAWYGSKRNDCDVLNVWTWLKTGVRDKLCDMLKNEITYQLKTISEDVTNETKEGTFEGNVLNVTGTIVLPSGSKVVDANISLKCPSNANCVWKEKKITSSSIDYVVSVTLLNDSARVDGNCSKSTGLCIKLIYTPSASNIPISGAMLLDPAGSSNLQRLIVFAPGDAQVSVPIYTKKITKDVCKTSDETVFQQLDCCNYITDHTSDLYRKYCKGGCLYSNFSLVCTVDKDGKGNVRDYYHVYEATESTENKPKVSGCVIDAEHRLSDSKFKDNYTDEAGNEYTVEAYKNNRYCRVSCYEAWDFSMAGFKDFVGTNAVVAGSFFQMNEDVYLSGKRTCVSSFTDYDQYLSDVSSVSEKMRKSFNNFSERGVVYDDLKNQTLGTTHFKNSKDATQLTVYNYDGKVSYHPKTDIDVCGYDSYSDYQSSASGYPANFCSGDYFNCNCSHSSYDYDCNCTGSGDKRKCSTCTTYTTTCSWNTYKGECWRVDSEPSLKCNRFELYSNNRSYDSYANSGEPHQKSASTAASDTFTSEAKTLSNDYVGSSSAVGGIFYQYPANGVCESDPGLTGNQTVSDATMYETLLSRTEYKGSNLISAMNSYAKEVNESLVTIQNYANEFSACQNFNILNTNDIRGKKYENNRVWYSYWGGHTGYDEDGFNYFDGKSYVVKNSKLLKSLSANIVKIPNAFSPQTAYKYEEKGFMAILNRNKSNVLEVNRDYNDGKFDGIEDDVPKGTCVPFVNGDGKTLDICNNKFQLNIYTGQVSNGKVNPWGSEIGKSYGSPLYESTTNSENDSTFLLCATTNYSAGRKKGDASKGECVSAQFYYYKANYIKQTIQNSSYFSNKGYWWVKQSTDVKDQELSRDDASKVYHDAAGKEGWSMIGTNHNVFPIGMTTRRNIYQYVYAFNDIGMYSNGKLGRVMSIDENSLLGFYTHACFYEVKEELCLCCGDPIETTIEEETRIDTSNKIVKVDGVKYDYSNESLISHDGVMSFYSSPVSLNDLDSGTGRKLASNWSSASGYYFGGVNYSTDKGSKLVKNIEEKGETVYDKTPEYSYTFDPSALAKIKNKEREYGVSLDKVKAFASFTLDESKTDKDHNPLVTFFANDALSVDFKNYITSEYKDSVLTNVKRMDKSCYVTADNVEEAQEKVLNCRFVYYLDSNKNGPSVRLAFK